MANKKTQSGTNIQKVQKQVQQSANPQNEQFDNEFASETDAQEIKKKNQQSQARKQQSTQNQQQQNQNQQP